jgi:hypothetical protein
LKDTVQQNNNPTYPDPQQQQLKEIVLTLMARFTNVGGFSRTCSVSVMLVVD